MRERCLVILDVAPLEAGRSGWSPRYAHLLRALVRHFDVTLRFLEQDPAETAAVAREIPPGVSLEAITVPTHPLAHPTWGGKLARAAHLVSVGRPLACRVHAPPAVVRRATRGTWDLAIVCLPWLTHLAPRVRAGAVYSFVEERWEKVVHQTTAELPRQLRQIVVGTELRRYESLYRHAVRRGIRLIAISPEEARAFDRTVGAGHTRCVPHGLPLERWTASEDVERDVDILTYGTVSVQANEEHLRQTIDAFGSDCEARWIVIAPGEVPRWLQERPMVDTTAEVADVRPYLARTKVCYVPSRFSTGVRTTILEAWAMGCAVVTSSGGERGLPPGAPGALRVGDDAEDCAHLIRQLLADDQERVELATQGRRIVTRADLPVIMKSFVDRNLIP